MPNFGQRWWSQKWNKGQRLSWPEQVSMELRKAISQWQSTILVFILQSQSQLDLECKCYHHRLAIIFWDGDGVWVIFWGMDFFPPPLGCAWLLWWAIACPRVFLFIKTQDLHCRNHLLQSLSPWLPLRIFFSSFCCVGTWATLSIQCIVLKFGYISNQSILANDTIFIVNKDSS